MANTATLSAKFRISIPRAVRERQQWKVGQRFVFLPKGKGVLLVPAPSRDALRGIAKGTGAEGWRDRDDRI